AGASLKADRLRAGWNRAEVVGGTLLSPRRVLHVRRGKIASVVRDLDASVRGKAQERIGRSRLRERDRGKGALVNAEYIVRPEDGERHGGGDAHVRPVEGVRPTCPVAATRLGRAVGTVAPRHDGPVEGEGHVFVDKVGGPGRTPHQEPDVLLGHAELEGRAGLGAWSS